MASDNSPLHEAGIFSTYDNPAFYCELMNRGTSLPETLQEVKERLSHLTLTDLRERTSNAENQLWRLGITFTVYTEREAIDRILPFDMIPRLLTAEEWSLIERGVQQRVSAINLFLWDIYHDRRILEDGIIPADLVLNNANYCKAMIGVDVPGGRLCAHQRN